MKYFSDAIILAMFSNKVSNLFEKKSFSKLFTSPCSSNFFWIRSILISSSFILFSLSTSLGFIWLLPYLNYKLD